jgi:dUTP pyrophosphatase
MTINGNVKIKIKLANPNFPLPKKAHENDAAYDLVYPYDSLIEIESGDRKLIPCGFSMELPEGYEAQIRPRSGLAIKQGITVLNNPGTIDADYRGLVQVILINLDCETFSICKGDRIAQMVIQPVLRTSLEVVDKLSDTDRGDGGFGSTGK